MGGGFGEKINPVHIKDDPPASRYVSAGQRERKRSREDEEEEEEDERTEDVCRRGWPSTGFCAEMRKPLLRQSPIYQQRRGRGGREGGRDGGISSLLNTQKEEED